MLKIHPSLVEESWPDEIVIVNLKRGFYYSLRGCGISIWPLLKEGTNEDSILKFLGQYYDGVLKGPIFTLIEEMRSAGLIVETDQPCPPFIPTAAAIDKKPFVAPIFQVFTEMEDLLQLDPIHDTDETGWPHQPNVR
jgi:hypothetical protein